MSNVVSHLAGPVAEFRTEQGTVVRQRCQWCGATLVDECTWLVSVPVGQDSTIPTWEVGRFVDVVAPDGRGGMWSASDWTEGPVPQSACLRMPLEVTR